MTDNVLNGTHDPRFDGVIAAIEENIASGEELGASMHVDIDGESVIDVWGGFKDQARTEPWVEDTITNVWSTSKTISALAALIVADRGLIDLDAPVATYWPEFAANGKEGVLVRHVLSHTSGVSAWQKPFELEDMYDWEKSTSILAAQAPWWKPGSGAGYHAQNYGHLLGEIIHRVTGKKLKEFVATEMAGPLGADFQIGAREEDWPRIADLVPNPPPEDPVGLPEDGITYKTLTSPLLDGANANTAAWRQADMGALNGHSNARGVARIMSAIPLGGTVDGVKLLSQDTLDRIFDVQAEGPDLVVGVSMKHGIGFNLPSPETFPWIPEGRICFWGGWGGSVIIMDVDRRMTISYMMNKMSPGLLGSPRSERYVEEVFKAVGA